MLVACTNFDAELRLLALPACMLDCLGRRMEPPARVDYLCFAAAKGDLPELRRLLAARPGLATATNCYGRTPLSSAAANGKVDALRLLLEAAPAAALIVDAVGYLPLHKAASSRSAEAVRLLLEAASPAAALTADAEGRLPLHIAAQGGNADAVRLLLEAAPVGATTQAPGGIPLEVALARAALFAILNPHAQYLEAARLLLPATPPENALSALEEAGQVALPLFADLAASKALSPAQWQRVPAPCPALGAALPAVLARSQAEAALLVGRLPAEACQRLRAGALCQGQAQREHGIELPVALVGRVLALAAGA